jgi:hypothetical protein
MTTILNVPGLENTSNAFKRKLVSVADWLGINPDHLATVISFESAKSFSPSIKNPFSGATGLIQFMPSTAKNLGTSVADLVLMSAEEQLDWVYQYFLSFKDRLHTLDDVYLAVFMPSFIGKPAESVVFVDGQKGYEQNKGFDPKNTGRITVGQITSTVHGVANNANGRIEVPDSDDDDNGSNGEMSSSAKLALTGFCAIASYLVFTRILG